MKTRFCPSPTGMIHLGNLRTALFNVLLARGNQCDFLIRIEDTDVVRSKEEYTAALLDDLAWLGLHWQEGPRVGGPNGPYWQSERQAIYDEYYQQMRERNLVYPCFCTEEQLALNRKIQRTQGLPPRYPGTCRHLSHDEVQEKIESGLTYTLRFRVADEGVIQFQDIVRGTLTFSRNDIGDFIISRNDGTASFMYCNAIDDALMGVTHVLRGEDHLTNTPRQLLILEALNLPTPQYGHISLMLGKDGSPLSKRNGSRSVRDLANEGYLPAAINNYLARLGHYYGHDHFMTLDELAAGFSCDNLVKAPSKFDEEQLQRWQKDAIMHTEPATLWAWTVDETKQRVPENLQDDFMKTIQGNILFPEDTAKWANAYFAPSLEHSHEGNAILKEAGVVFFETALEIILRTGTDFKLLASEISAQLGLKGKALFMPLRVALTGETSGPELQNALPLMGSEIAKKRFEQIIFHM